MFRAHIIIMGTHGRSRERRAAHRITHLTHISHSHTHKRIETPLLAHTAHKAPSHPHAVYLGYHPEPAVAALRSTAHTHTPPHRYASRATTTTHCTRSCHHGITGGSGNGPAHIDTVCLHTHTHTRSLIATAISHSSPRRSWKSMDGR